MGGDPADKKPVTFGHIAAMSEIYKVTNLKRIGGCAKKKKKKRVA